MKPAKQYYSVTTPLFAGEVMFRGFTTDPDYRYPGCEKTFLDPVTREEMEQVQRCNPGYETLLDGKEPTNEQKANALYGQRQQKAHGCFCGLRGLEIEMTIEQALGASHQGECDADVEALLRVPEIAAQFDAMSADEIRAALKEYGAWDESELQDDHQNRLRALWSAACDIRENHN